MYKERLDNILIWLWLVAIVAGVGAAFVCLEKDLPVIAFLQAVFLLCLTIATHRLTHARWLRVYGTRSAISRHLGCKTEDASILTKDVASARGVDCRRALERLVNQHQDARCLGLDTDFQHLLIADSDLTSCARKPLKYLPMTSRLYPPTRSTCSLLAA
jgi:hypothetical protein